MKLNCELTQDLLPLYAEGMLREGNRKLVQEHLDSCESCRALLSDIVSPELEIRYNDDGLKGFRKRMRRHTFTVAAGTAFAVILIALLVWSCFMDGSDALGYALVAMYMVLPLSALICGVLLGLRESKVKWIAPVAFGAAACLIPLLVFQYTELGFFVFIFVFSLIGSVIGHVIRLMRNRKKKQAA